jgi:hypothetical protein
MKKILAFLAALLTNVLLFAQPINLPYISIRARTSVSGGEFSIDIHFKEDTLKIIYKLKDRTIGEMEKDVEGIRYRDMYRSIKNLNPRNDTIIYLIHKLDSINQVYTSYRIDSIELINTENISYFNLINQVLNSSIAILENKPYNESRGVLDGTLIVFTVVSNGVAKTAYANSPSPASHPLLYSLLNQTLNLHRERHKNSFLTVKATNGY